MSDFDDKLKKKTEMAEEVIESYLPKEETRQSDIMRAMNYSVTAGGKRLRPILMYEVAMMFGCDSELVKPFMAVMEFIHTYSLVHDDLPAMDDDDYRRGRKTTHVEFGEAMGILAGDGLLNYAYEIGMNAVVNGKEIEKKAKALKVIADKAGIYGMVGGQTVDVLSEGKELDKDMLDYINERKTGALIEASMMAGAILGGASDEETKIIEKAASYIGMAFQIQDDILDVISTSEELGKPVHSDEKNLKSTYVTIMGLEQASNEVEWLTDNGIELLKSLNRDNDFLFELIKKLVNRSK